MHRYVLLVGLAGLAAMLSGAFITSRELVSGQPEPVSAVHLAMAIGAAILDLSLCVWVSVAKANPPIRALAWSSFIALAISGVVGWKLSSVVLHACLGHLSLGCVAAVAVMMSPAWSHTAQPVNSRGWRLLRPAASIAPAAVFLQIVLGALYRHQVTGVMPHMAGAMVVALLTLVVSVMVLQHFPECRELQRSATALVSVVLGQVCLGITVFVMLLLEAGNTPYFVWAASGHVATGALLLAASIWMALQVRRDLLP